ncbi:hypothetical protein J4401_00995 [Candidatus Woesearchaeota archaeon]|nr:hypothetical protein [Candidatus Woesearchaeota archaeon]
MPIEYIKGKVHRHGKKFSIFAVIGAFKGALTVFLSWLMIDFLKLQTFTASIIIVATMFFIAYFIYVITGIIKQEFIKYLSATIVFDITIVFGIWLLVDILRFSGAISSAIVIGFLFVVRYAFFGKIGLLKFK